MIRRTALFALAAAGIAPAAHAQVTALRALDGIECRVVRETPATAACYAGVRDGGNPAACNLPAVRREPRAGSDVVGRVGSRVLVVPGQRTNGFTGAVLPNGQPGWIEDAWLAPVPRGEVCEAVVLSNNRLGFKVR